MEHPNYKVRDLYLKKVIPHIRKPLIKVFTGLRRSGKSYLILSVIDFIQKEDPAANIIYINKEYYEFDTIRDYHQLQDYFDQNHQTGTNNYLFVDEIQEIEGFEKSIRNIFSKNMADIYISGSNAEILSGELATMLSGRYVEIQLHPLSYPEFLNFYNLSDSAEAFDRYLKHGGMPGLMHVSSADGPIRDYLRGILSTVLMKDVVSRYNIRNVTFLENLIRYLSDNIASLISAKSISDFLKSQRIKVTPNLVLDYLNHLCRAYFANKVSRMDLTGKRIFDVGEKYFFEDLGLRNILVGYKPGDISKLLENVVYNHLIIAGYKVYVCQKGVTEIDFVAERDGETIYVQVCYLLSTNKVVEREFGNLLQIKDNYRKYVVSMDENLPTHTFKGIEHCHIRTFCKQILF